MAHRATTLILAVTLAAAGTFGAVWTGAAPAVRAAAEQQGADGSFTADQASDGWSVYGVQCEECHGPALEGMVHAPPLNGVEFLELWAGRTTDELFTYLRDEMPPGQAGALSDQAYVGLVAYLLEANGAVPGDRTLTLDAGVMIGDAADIEEARRAAGAGERPRRRSTRFVNREVPHDADPGDRRAAGGSAAGRLADVAPDPQQPRLQPARSGDARERRRSEARLVARDPVGQPPDDAARA